MRIPPALHVALACTLAVVAAPACDSSEKASAKPEPVSKTPGASIERSEGSEPEPEREPRPAPEAVPAKEGSPAAGTESPLGAILALRASWGAACPERLMGLFESGPPPPPPPPPPPRWKKKVTKPATLPTVEKVDPPQSPISGGDATLPLAETLDRWPGSPADLAAALTKAAPDNEDVHCVLSFVADLQGDGKAGWAHAEARAKAFPDSAAAHLGLAVRWFADLLPDADSGMPYNVDIPPGTRIGIASSVIRETERAIAIKPDYRAAYVLAAVAYQQIELARGTIEDPQTPDEVLQWVLAREDAMKVWRQHKAIADLDGQGDCPLYPAVPTDPCVPPPPLTAAEQAADAKLKNKLLGK